MTTLRTAAQQALDTLLKSHTCPLMPDDCEAAIAALRAALKPKPPKDCMKDVYESLRRKAMRRGI